jgi:hypothetical protein
MRPEWEQVKPGLEVATVLANVECSISDSKITVVRMDQSYYKVELVTGAMLDVTDVAIGHNADVAINAGMYLPLGTPCGFFAIDGRPIQRRWNRNYIGSFVIRQQGVHIVESQHKYNYENGFQSILMMHNGVNLRKDKSKRYHSICAVGLDIHGRIITLHSRTPYSIYQFGELVKDMKININHLLYMEGGPEATMRVADRVCIGSYETGLWEHDAHCAQMKLPNYIVFKRV